MEFIASLVKLKTDGDEDEEGDAKEGMEEGLEWDATRSMDAIILYW